MSVGFFLLLIPTVHAADGQTVEAAEARLGAETTSHEQILQAIEATKQTDPELAREMEQQLQLLESGQLDPRTLGTTDHGAPSQPGELPGGTPLPMPVVDVGGGQLSPPGGTDDSLPPEARQELEALFQQGTGDPNSETDRALREQAGEILERYGIDPREMGAGHEGEHDEGRHEGFERAFEQMAPEAREQMERHFGQEREQMEWMQREFESTERTFEAPTHDYEAPTQERPTYEAPTREYDAPTHEYEAPRPEYESPGQGPGDGSGMGPH